MESLDGARVRIGNEVSDVLIKVVEEIETYEGCGDVTLKQMDETASILISAALAIKGRLYVLDYCALQARGEEVAPDSGLQTQD